MRRVELGTGVTLAVWEQGTGVPVLLLHAWGETHRTFDRLRPLIPGTLHLIVPDQRGVGASTKPAHGYSLAEAAADAVGLLDALGIDSCWVVGTSSGGYVAQQITVDHPDRVRGLVLVGSPSDLSGSPPAALVDRLATFHDPVTRADIDALNDAFPLHTAVPASFLDDQANAALTIPRSVWQATLAGLGEAEPPVRRLRLRVPTLVLWGAEDDLLPAAQADELVAAIDGSRLVRYESTGHLVLWERPERVAADLTAFIADQDQAV